MSSDLKNLMEKFLGDSPCLLVEPSPVFSTNIQQCLVSLGISAQRIMTARNYQDALSRIEKQAPKLLVTEYQAFDRFGLSLIEKLEKKWDESSRISVMVTNRSADSTIAEAAEGQVDAVLLKPFSTEAFRNKLHQVMIRKANPSPYQLALDEGKKRFAEKDVDGALASFNRAKELMEKPSLACYFVGQCYRQKDNLPEALRLFREGREHQPLHYKCLVGEFEILVAEKKFPEAFQLIEPIKSNYPLSAKRLEQLFVVATMTRQFAAVTDYIPFYSRLEQRPSSLVKTASQALLAAGRYSLAQKDFRIAMDAYDKGLVVTEFNMDYLAVVIGDLSRAGLAKEAQQVLARVPTSFVGTPEFNCLSFQVDRLSLPVEQMIVRGRKLVLAGDANPTIYISLVELMVKAGKATLAESVIFRALEEFPEMKAQLYGLLEKNSAVA